MYARRILHHGASPTGTPVVLDDRAVAGCWFELHRQGGCGAGQLTLVDDFLLRQTVQVGDWVSLEFSSGVRWYLGRVEERQAHSPAKVRLRLEGMGVQLNEVFPGGFGSDADGQRPLRFADTDLFTNDPDRQQETVERVTDAVALIRRLIMHYVTPATSILYDPALIEASLRPAPVNSLKVRGEESVRSLIKELALRAGGAAWGVNAEGKFFLTQPKTATSAVYREGQTLLSLTETCDRELLFNRVLLTGDYIYDTADRSGAVARRVYRWRGNFLQPESRQQYGDRRIRLWVPWIRTQNDSLAFIRSFFRTYAQPTRRFSVETLPITGHSTLPIPWQGRIRLEDRQGHELTTAAFDTIRVEFDNAPRFRLEVGPEDPRNLWPEPPQDERWEIPHAIPSNGGDVSLTHFPSSGESSGGGGGSSGGGGGGGGGGHSSHAHSSHSNHHSSNRTSTNMTSSDWTSDAGSESGSGYYPLAAAAGPQHAGPRLESLSARLKESLSDGTTEHADQFAAFAEKQGPQRPIVVIPFTAGDALATRWLLEWIIELGGTRDFACLLLNDFKMSAEQVTPLIQLAEQAFGCVVTKSTPYALDDERWPAGPNWMFETALEILRNVPQPFLWLEPDCTPLGSGWLERLSTEYVRAGRPFLGVLVPAQGTPERDDYCPLHLTGCAIYPPQAAALLQPYCRLTQTGGYPIAWDVASCAISVGHTSNTSLIANHWGKWQQPPTYVVSRSHDDPPHALELAQISKSAVLAHRCKDGSLIRSLRDARSRRDA